MTTCVACGSANAATHKFCAECGQPLAAAVTSDPDPRSTPLRVRDVIGNRFAIEGERKLVTVLFCDIADSTKLASAIGPDAMHALIDAFFKLALREVEAVEGMVNQLLGDGFMALFGAPVAHEDHARRALTAALAMRRRLDDASPGALRELKVRIGAHTGFVVVGRIGADAREDYTAVGETTHLAARLQQLAMPDEIHVSDATRRATQAWFEFAPVGRKTMKGFAEPVEVFALRAALRSGRAAARASVVESTLVGREAELETLTSSLRALEAGRGTVTVIEGDAGVGKSRLVGEARASFASLAVVEGRAVSFGSKLPYWPFLAILRAWFGIDDGDADATSLRKVEASSRALFDERASELIPYFATVLALPMTREHEERVRFLDAQALGSQVFRSMRELFERRARLAPTLVVLEDWHWVDHSSVALCEHLLPLAKGAALSFWFVTRKEPAERAEQIRAATTACGLPLQELRLAPLDQAHSNALVDNLVGADVLTHGICRDILRRTEGNPFFIEEVVRSFIADGSLAQDAAGTWHVARPIDASRLPQTVQGVIVARIDRLDEAAKATLKMASVIGRNFFLRILETISAARATVVGDCDRLERADLICHRQRVPEIEFMFRHALVQEAAYGSILAERRRNVHRDVARAIEGVFADRIDEFSGLLAYHYALAEDWENAREYLFKAGDRAGRISADVEALDYYSQAERVFLEVAGKELEPLQRATLDRKLGQALYGVGRYDEAVERFTGALATLGIRYPTTRIGVRLAILRFCIAHFAPRLFGAVVRPKRIALAEAREISVVCQSLVWLDYFVDEERFALDGLIELYAGERSDDLVARVRGLGSFGAVLMITRRFGLAARRIDEAVALAEASGYAAAIGGARFVRGWLDWNTGARGLGWTSLEIAAAAYRSIGDLRRWGGPSYRMVSIALQQGRYDVATRIADDLVRMGEDTGDPHLLSWGLTARGAVYRITGPLDDAIACLHRVRDICASISSFRQMAEAAGGLARCHLWQGRWADAEAAIAETVDLIGARKLRSSHWFFGPLNACVELRIRQAEALPADARSRAIDVAERAAQLALRQARNAPTWVPETRRQMGTIAWLRGRTAAMHEHWRASLDCARALDLDAEHARTLLEMGTRLGDRALVDEAVDVFRRQGAAVDLARAVDARDALAS